MITLTLELWMIVPGLTTSAAISAAIMTDGRGDEDFGFIFFAWVMVTIPPILAVWLKGMQ